MAEFKFEKAFDKDDDERILDMYGTLIHVAIPQINPCIFDLNEPFTKHNLLKLFGKEKKINQDIMVLLFPERWLSPPQRRALVSLITKHPEVKEYQIITQDEHILHDCIYESVVLLKYTKAGKYKGKDYLNISPFAANRDQIYLAVWGKNIGE